MILKGYIENTPFDLSTGVKDLDLNNSLFYLNGENFKYSNEQLDLSSDKNELIEKIADAKKISQEEYTKTTYENLEKAINIAEELVKSTNVLGEEIAIELENIKNSINNLRKVNKIEFKGYNNVVFMTLGFDTENNKFEAVSNSEMIHPYQYSKVYAKVEHFDQKGNLKGEYKAIANKTADEMASALNNLSYEDGDYIKLSHLEKNNRLVTNGYVENAPYDLSTGCKDLDLVNSYFYLGEENLKYSNKQLDLSGDKTELVNKIKELKEVSSDKYTKTSFENLLNAIEKAEDLVNTNSVYDEEILSELKTLENAKNNLRELNEVVFKGYNNNEFLKLSFDSENKVLKAVSNGEVANRFVSGKYAEITHFDKDGNVKGTYSIRGVENADNLANSLNNLEYVEGDSLKLFHGEQNSRLAIKGYINNLDSNLSNGVGNINLNNTRFYLDGESLTYKISQ
ncbi:MAG: putative mucin/carbohydrate-binding domain-containing protein [Clostridium sp.]